MKMNRIVLFTYNNKEMTYSLYFENEEDEYLVKKSLGLTTKKKSMTRG
jgi:hypothetical protein